MSITITLDTSITCFERELDFAEIMKQAEHSKNQRKQDSFELGYLPEFPVLDETELEREALKFQEIYLKKGKKEALKFFSDLHAHCRKYVMAVKPYKNYLKSCKIQF